MKFKHIAAVLAGAAALSAPSCDLNEKFYSEVTPDTFFTSPESTYAVLCRPFTHWKWYIGADRWYLQELTTDEMTCPKRGADWYNGGEYYRLHYHTWSPDDRFVVNTYDGTTGEVLESVRAYVPSKQGNRGSVVTLEARDLNMGYRKSRVHDDGLIVISATFKLSPSTPAMVRAAMDDYRARREEKQPLEMASAGSTFKRPAGYFAGKLIMDAGLRGARVGDAQVSEKHCGFVVNTGHASAKDVLGLIEHVQSEVKAQFGVDLEPEVRMVGEF